MKIYIVTGPKHHSNAKTSRYSRNNSQSHLEMILAIFKLPARRQASDFEIQSLCNHKEFGNDAYSYGFVQVTAVICLLTPISLEGSK